MLSSVSASGKNAKPVSVAQEGTGRVSHNARSHSCVLGTGLLSLLLAVLTMSLIPVSLQRQKPGQGGLGGIGKGP